MNVELTLYLIDLMLRFLDKIEYERYSAWKQSEIETEKMMLREMLEDVDNVFSWIYLLRDYIQEYHRAYGKGQMCL